MNNIVTIFIGLGGLMVTGFGAVFVLYKIIRKATKESEIKLNELETKLTKICGEVMNKQEVENRLTKLEEMTNNGIKKEIHEIKSGMPNKELIETRLKIQENQSEDIKTLVKDVAILQTSVSTLKELNFKNKK